MIDYQKTIPVLELYTCIQTEGSLAGIPHFLVRTTGCTHRCWFGEGGWCDSWYTSIHPEKPKFSLDDIISIIKKNPHIKHLMLTGGSPTMHVKLMEEVLHISHMYGLKTTLETEGSHFWETEYKFDVISISPKFSNSIPKVGIETPMGKKVTDKMVKQHNKFRLNKETINSLISYHNDYHFKPVWDGLNMEALKEIEEFIKELRIPKEKVWFMPAGSTLEELQPNYSRVMEYCITRGYNFTGRAQIVGYGTKRGV